MASRDELLDLVKDALANLYDPVHLQTHPLVDILAIPRAPWSTTGESLRALLRETIGSLKPPSSVPMTRPEWVGYRVLWLRYVRLQSEAEVRAALNISEATYFRRQREALDAVTSILWQRVEAADATGREGTMRETAVSAEEARAHAVHLAGATAPQALDLAELLSGVRTTIFPLARQQRVTLTFDVPPSLPQAYGQPSLLRQIILSVLAECIKLWPGSTLQLSVRLRP